MLHAQRAQVDEREHEQQREPYDADGRRVAEGEGLEGLAVHIDDSVVVL